MLNLSELCTYFRAGISVVAIDSPTAAENAVLQALAVEFQAGRIVQTWDCSNQLQTVALRVDENAAVVRLESKPDVNFKSQGHPVEAILKHIIQLCQAPSSDIASAKILFVLKDLYAFVTGSNANAVLVRTLKDCCFALKRSRHRLVILHDGQKTPIEFQDLIAVMQHRLPGESETRDILQQRITMLQQAAILAERRVNVNLDESGYKRLVRSLLGMTQEGMEDTLQLVITRDGIVDESTITAIAAIKQQRFATQGVEYAQAPDVAVQGMPNLSSWAKTLARLLEPMAQEAWNIPFPKGVLLAGEGGTGKTLAVKCLAQELGLPVIVLDTSKLMQKELGASEENLRRIIAAAESMAPSILFIDEIDKALGYAESDGGTSSRMFGYLLQWFQEHQSAVFVAATVNEPWRLKPELLRRFSKAFLVDLPDIEARKSIFQVQTCKFKLPIADHDLQTLAEQTPDFTGDEIRKVVHECAADAYAQGHPGEISMAMYLSQINCKEPQFRNNRDRLDQLRAWMSAGNAEPVRNAPIHPDLQHDRVTAVEFA
jgi:AAA+ superfamily predicted ATPase